MGNENNQRNTNNGNGWNRGNYAYVDGVIVLEKSRKKETQTTMKHFEAGKIYLVT